MPLSSSPFQQNASKFSGQRVLLTTWPDEAKLRVIGVLGQALRLRGAEPLALLCDSALHVCEVLPQLGSEIAPFLARSQVNLCRWCFTQTEAALQGLQLPLTRLSSYVREDYYESSLEAVRSLTLSEILAYKHQDLDLGEHVRTSLHRFFLSSSLDDNDSTRAVGKRYLATAIQLAEGLNRLMDEFQPDVVVMFHGIYLINGTCMEVVMNRAIRAVTWDLVYRKNCIQLSHGDTYHHEFRMEPWEAWESCKLSQEQSERLDAYVAKRRGGTLLREAFSSQRGEIADRSHTTHKTDLAPTRRNVVLFTNVSWDGRVKVPSQLYEGPTEWVIDTLRQLSEREDLRVIVRIHPHEVKTTARKLQRVEEILSTAFPDLPRNVTLILPENPVSSYALAEVADVVIVYSTQVGLEALLMGRPVIITGDAFYSNKGFGIQPQTQEEYLQVLERLFEIEPLNQQELERVRRYAYHFYFRRWIQLPLGATYYDGETMTVSQENLLPGMSEGLDRACEGILHGTPFHAGAP